MGLVRKTLNYFNNFNVYSFYLSAIIGEEAEKIDTFGQQLIDFLSLMGKCLLQGGLWKGQDRSPSSTCNKWEKWAPLK